MLYRIEEGEERRRGSSQLSSRTDRPIDFSMQTVGDFPRQLLVPRVNRLAPEHHELTCWALNETIPATS